MPHGANGQKKPPALGGAVDLTRAKLTEQDLQDMQEILELQSGMRCGGCGHRVTIGMRFYAIDPRAENPMASRVACSRPECTYMEECRPHATAMEMVEFAWIDENGPDAPAARVLVEALAKEADRLEEVERLEAERDADPTP